MGNYSNWFVFFVQTGQERISCDFLNKLLAKEYSTAFIPQIELIYKNMQFVRKELKPMFPGYIFIDTIQDESKFIVEANKYARFSKCIYRLLGNQSTECMKLCEYEKNYLLGFLDNKYITHESIGYIIGDEIIINSGPLIGKESIIKKIDRHKKRAEIEIMCLGDIRRISVSLEIVSKIKNNVSPS